MLILIVPTRWESEAVLSALSNPVPDPAWDVPAWRVSDLLVVEPGMGPDLAAALLPRLESLAPQELWLYGWCGGLSPELDVGDLVLADVTIFIGEDGQTTHISHPAPESLVVETCRLAQESGRRMVVGPALTSYHVLSSVEQKRAGAASGAVVVEMEAGPLAQWAAGRSVPFVHLRVVLDPAGSALPKTDLPTDEHGYAQSGALFSHALAHPGEWPALWRLFRQIRTARRVMTDVVGALAWSGGPLGTERALT
jgi:nucleoside phosphorylase